MSIKIMYVRLKISSAFNILNIYKYLARLILNAIASQATLFQRSRLHLAVSRSQRAALTERGNWRDSLVSEAQHPSH